MSPFVRSRCRLGLAAILFASAVPSLLFGDPASLDFEQKIGHVLNRITYGPSPADTQRIREIGVSAYLYEQLNPHKIKSAPDPRLAKGIAKLYLDVIPGSGEFLIRQGENWHYHKGKTEPPVNWTSLDFDANSWPVGPSGFGYGDDDDKTLIEDMQGSDEQPGYLSLYVRKVFEIEDPKAIHNLFMRIGYDDGFVAYLNGKEVLRMNIKGKPPRHNQVASTSSGTVERGAHDTFPLNEANALLRKGRNVLALQVHNHRIGSSDLTLIPELAHAPDPPAKVLAGVKPLQQMAHLRGIYSKNQLQTVLGEFWENHFCTDFDKVEDYIDDLPAYEQLQSDDGEDAIERQIASEAAGIEFQEYEFLYQNALGHFGDLLLYSATSPSMLIYLDSVLNVKAEPNENYAREILELYTCGVDNRYTQQDIEELAKCFTGWTIRKMNPEDKPSFPKSAREPSTEPSLAVAHEKVLMDLGPGWKYFKGKREPSPDKARKATINWTMPGFNDQKWASGETGFGYGDGDDKTVLRDMQGRYVSLYLRKEIELALPHGYDAVVLEMGYDDGYVAYLNGTEIGRSGNMQGSGTPPKFNAIVDRNHEADEDVDTIDLTEFRSLIKPPPAKNTLSIQAHNGSRNSSDFSILPRIVARNYKPGSTSLTNPLGIWTFRYRPEQHDPGEKVLFKGTEHEIRIPANSAGVSDALSVIDALVAHPSTSEFIIVKLLNKFVSDQISLESYHKRTAPKPLLDLMDEAIIAWNSTPRPGHLKTVMETILDPDDHQGPFWSSLAHQSKIKTPVEFINSCFRALDAEVVSDNLPNRMDDMGMTPFQRDDPDGYSELGFEWMDTHSLLERLRLCQDLAINGRDSAGKWSLEKLMRDHRLTSPESIIDYFNRLLFQGKLTDRRKAVLLEFVNTNDAGKPDPVARLKGQRRLQRLRQMVGLILSTQEFQFQ